MPSNLAPLVPPTPQRQSPTPTALEQALATHLAGVASGQVSSLAVDPPRLLEQGNPYESVILDLSGASTGPTPNLSTTVSTQIDRRGYSLYYRREGSSPAGRLMVNMGGEFVDFYPGCRIKGPFNQLFARLSLRSTKFGNAVLIVEKDPNFRFREPLFNPPPGEVFPAIDLLGNSLTPTFIAQTITASNGPAPSGAPGSQAGAFIGTGYRTLRMLIDGGSVAGNITSFNLIPWIWEPNSQLWYAQTDQTINVLDSTPTGQRYRVVSIPIYGSGYYYFQFVSFSGSGTTPGQIVQALE